MSYKLITRLELKRPPIQSCSAEALKLTLALKRSKAILPWEEEEWGIHHSVMFCLVSNCKVRCRPELRSGALILLLSTLCGL